MIDPVVFKLLSYGMYVVASFRPSTPLGTDPSTEPVLRAVEGLGTGRKLNGQIATTVFQVTAEPPQLAVCLNCRNLTHELVKDSQRFSVSILSTEAPLNFIGLFGFKCGRDVDKYSGINHRVLASGTPVITDHSLGWLDLEVAQSVDLGTHTMFIGRVIESGTIPPGEAFDPAQAKPMTYAYYHAVKGGKTQANAPTYIKE